MGLGETLILSDLFPCSEFSLSLIAGNEPKVPSPNPNDSPIEIALAS